MGRRPKNPDSRETLNLIFKAQSPEMIQQVQTIAKREGVTVKELLNRAWEEYRERRGKGNYQTLMGSYAEGGVKSDGQLEQAIVKELLKKYSREVLFRDILQACREYGFKKDVSAAGDRVAKLLMKEGRTVWR